MHRHKLSIRQASAFHLTASIATLVCFGSAFAPAATVSAGTPPQAFSTVSLRAYGTPLYGAWPTASIRVNGKRYGVVNIASAKPADYTIRTPLIPPGARVDIVFSNDASKKGVGDRNLFVESITINGQTLSPTAPGVVFDRGGGAAAFDGVDVLPGRTDLRWNGALRFVAPAADAVTAVTRPAHPSSTLPSSVKPSAIKPAPIAGPSTVQPSIQPPPAGQRPIAPPETQVAVTLEPESASVTHAGRFRIDAAAGVGTAKLLLILNGVIITEAPGDETRFDVPYTDAAQRTDTIEVRALDDAGAVIGSANLSLPVSIGRVFYVSGAGSDGSSGLSPSAAKRTLQAASNLTGPGDTVLVMDGTYSVANLQQNVLTIDRSGTADRWIVYASYPGQKPLIKARNWNAVSVNASYITVDGLTMQGNLQEVTLEQAQAAASDLNNPITSGNGVTITTPYNNKNLHPHHVVVRRCEVFDFPGGGISSVQADYVTIADNKIYRTSWYSPYANSAISNYQNWNADDSTGVKMVITGNTVFENQNLIPFYYSGTLAPGATATDPTTRKVTDGNGIIIDDAHNTQHNSSLGGYKGRTRIANNVAFNNGARGIMIYESDNVEIVNNTSVRNAGHEGIDSDLGFVNAAGLRIENNIVVARPDRQTSLTRNAAGATAAANLIFGKPDPKSTLMASSIVADPAFVDPDTADFRLRADSPAIDVGLSANAPKRDLTGARRPRGNGPDLGALERR